MKENLLTPSMICRTFIYMVRRELGPEIKTELSREPFSVCDGLIQRHVSVEISHDQRRGSLDDLADYLIPHANGFAALLRMAHIWQTFELPLDPCDVRETICRHLYDGLSMRAIVFPFAAFPAHLYRFDVLFRPKELATNVIVKLPRVA